MAKSSGLLANDILVPRRSQRRKFVQELPYIADVHGASGARVARDPPRPEERLADDENSRFEILAP